MIGNLINSNIIKAFQKITSDLNASFPGRNILVFPAPYHFLKSPFFLIIQAKHNSLVFFSVQIDKTVFTKKITDPIQVIISSPHTDGKSPRKISHRDVLIIILN